MYNLIFVTHLHFAQVIAQHNDNLLGLLVVVKLQFIVSYYAKGLSCVSLCVTPWALYLTCTRT